MNFPEKLTNYLKASYPFLWIRTHEELRISNEIFQTFKAKDKVEVYEWDVQGGLTIRDKRTNTNTKVNKSASLKDLTKTLVELGNEQVRACIILKDFHPFWESHALVRDFRNIAEALKNRGNMVIFISPVIKIPVELEKEIQILDYSLPDEAAIQARLEHVKLSVETRDSKNKLVLSDDVKQSAVEAAKGMTTSEVENAFTLALVTHQKFNQQFVKTVFTEKVAQVKKSGLLQYIEPDVDFSQVGGLDALKGWLKVRSGAYSANARKYGLPYPKGALLCGIPGCGKSLIAKATANEFKFPLFQLDVGGLFGRHVGETEENFRKVIDLVEGIGRCVLYIDEIEKALNKDAVSGKGDTGTSSRSFGTLLTWLNDHKSPVFVIGTSNDFTVLPPEFLRKGRFDEMFWLDLPDQTERADIFKVLLRKYQRKPEEFNVAKMAELADQLTGAEIEQAIVSALFNRFAKSPDRDIDTTAVLDEIHETIPIAKTFKDRLETMRKEADGRLRIAVRDGVAASFEKGLRKIEMSEQLG